MKNDGTSSPESTQLTQGTPARRALIPLGVGMLALAVFTAAINLRAGIASVGAVLPAILDTYREGGSVAGFITAMPGLFFALMGLAAVPLALRWGLSRVLYGGMIATLLGLAIRPWSSDIGWFLVLSALVVMGIAVANVLVPAWIKEHGGRHIVMLMTMYTSVLGLSGALGPLSALFFPLDDTGWRYALVLWAIPALAQVLVWTVVVLRLGKDAPTLGSGSNTPADGSAPQAAGQYGSQISPAAARASLWSSPTAVFLLLFFGLQSMAAYVQMGWLPQMLVDSGVSSHLASTSLALVGALNVAGGVLMPRIIDRSTNLGTYPVIFGAVTFIGWGGVLYFGHSAPLVWAFLLGIGGFCFPTALALIPARTRSSMVTARLSGFVQPYGYLVAAAGPLLVGIVHEHAGSWTPVLWGLMIAAILMGAVGWRASRRVVIDEELAFCATGG